MRPIIRDWVQLALRHLPMQEPIYEFGALQVEDQQDLANMRPLFPGREYVGCDMRAGPGVDRVLNLHALDLADECVGSVLLLDTLEHVEFCRKALSEVHRVLRPGGIALASSVMNFQIHEYPNDFWRFTPEGFRSLFGEFETVLVEWAGRADHPHTVVAVACKGLIPIASVEAYCAEMTPWKRQASKPKKPSLGSQLLPPFLNHLDRKIVKAWRRWRSAEL